MCGQAYDGASNMSGKTNARTSSVYPPAIYTHCVSHCLNLAVVASFEEPSIRNMISIVNRPSAFFFALAHPKQQKKLEEAIQNTQPGSNVLKLKDLCSTRWVECIDTLDQVKHLHSSVVACFVQMKVLPCGLQML